jgi:tripartite-type tricarboxylate transporter receptor subunit TctC
MNEDRTRGNDRRRWLQAGSAALASSLMPGSVRAQSPAAPAAPSSTAAPWPVRPIRWIVPYSPGSGADISARGLARVLPPLLGQPIVIENQPGGAAIPASRAVARAAPDGYTLLFSATQHAINPAFDTPLPYDTLTDFTPVARLTSQPLFLTVSSTIPATTVAELVAWARARPGQLNYASTGVGTSIHLSGAYFASRAGLDVRHVPYKNASDVMGDLARGEVHWIFYTWASVLSLLRSGKARVLGSSGAQRSGWAPEVPTMEEAGYPGFVLPAWQGLFGPAGLPAQVTATLHRAIAQALNDPEVIKLLDNTSTEPFLAGQAEFAPFLRSQIARYREIVRLANIKLD